MIVDKDAIDKCRAILSNMSTLGVYPYRQQAKTALMYLDIGLGVTNEIDDNKN